MTWVRSVVLLFSVAACSHVFSPNAPEPPARKSRIDLKISGFRAPSGAHIVFVPDPKAREAEVTVRYKVGAIDDPPGKEGMAHLVEHLMFAPVVNGQSLFARLESQTSYFNGETGLDTTTYVERAPAAKLGELIDIEAARASAQCSAISRDVFEREREVVINEIRQRGNLQGTVFQLIYPAGHPYHRAPGGSETSLRSITLADACAFVEHHYGASAAVIVVSGDVTSDAFTQATSRLVDALPTRQLAPQPDVPPVTAGGQRSLAGGFHGLILAWPLPKDPAVAAIVTAMARFLGTAITTDNSHVWSFMFGGDRAPMVALAIALDKSEPVETALARVRGGLTKLRGDLGQKVFEHFRSQASHLLFEEFEDGAARDLVLARDVEAGGDAGAAFSHQVQAIENVKYAQAQQIAQDALALDRAIQIDVEPSAPVARQAAESIEAPIHQAGQPRLDVDPAEARQPALSAGAPDPLHGALTRRLANGLTVVLLPMSSVPAVEVRLVIATGTADDPRGKAGTVWLGANASGVERTRDNINQMLQFYQAGGDYDVRVERDRVTYAVDGLDMHLDYLLTGLAQEIHAIPEKQLAAAIQKAPVRTPKPADPWLVALYGKDHPYAAPRGLDAAALDASAILEFRDAHVTPDNATLVIAGGFDPQVANAWIDYLFGEWRGHAAPRVAPRAVVTAASLGRVHDGAQVGIEIAMGASGDPPARAAQLVAAEMASELVDDVRHQLGASYGVEALLVEQRLATHYLIGGDIEAGRAVEAIELVRDRLEQLRSGGGSDELARVFVRARARVIARLGSYTSGSSALAGRVEHAIELGRSLHADAATEGAVRALTLDHMASALGELDLSRAAIRVQGPRDAVTAVFAALGRTPTFGD